MDFQRPGEHTTRADCEKICELLYFGFKDLRTVSGTVNHTLSDRGFQARVVLESNGFVIRERGADLATITK